MSMSQRVIGWGYEGKCGDDLLEFVNDNSAVAVVDVRLHAASRKPDFRKRALAERLERAGVQYLHLPQLGNPKDNREAFANPESREAQLAHERFVTEVARQPEAQDALGVVARIAEGGVVVLVCYEDDETRCHRSLVLAEMPSELVCT